MPIPNHQSIVEECKRLHPQDWADCHTGNANTEGFVRKLAPMLRNVDLHYGLNGKRGNPNDISDDVVNYLCEAEDSAGRTPDGRPCAIIDFAVGAGGPNPTVGWNVMTTSPEADGAWVAPGAVQPPAPQPQPPQVVIPPFPPRDETMNFGLKLNAHYASKGAGQNGTLGGRLGTEARHTDYEGEIIWTSEYLRRRQLGQDHETATAAVLLDVDAAWPK